MVYILEDDVSILELILYALNSQSIESKGFGTPKDFWDALENEVPNILVLDVMLPDETGFEILKKLKNNPKTKHISVLMLTALNNEVDKVRGLDLGADDYITKPFGMMEFLARIRAILRRVQTDLRDIFCLDGLTFSLTAHEVRINNSPIELTLKEFELLGLLLKNLECVLCREELLESIWGYNYTSETRTVDIHIKTLRQKLGIWGSKIKTIRGVGYKLSKEN